MQSHEAPSSAEEMAVVGADQRENPQAERPPTRHQKAATTLAPPALRITRGVIEQIYRTIGRLPAEHGGALGGSRADGIVTHFQFDRSARRSSGSYSPDHHLLNRLFKELWNPAGINLLGFIHSHPPGIRAPSGGDLHYARRIFAHIPELEALLLPIVISEADTGLYELLPYVVVRADNDIAVMRTELEMVDGAESGAAKSPAVAAEVQPPYKKSAGVDAPAALECVAPAGDRPAGPVVAGPASASSGEAPPFVVTMAFSRVEHAYDLPLLARCRLIAVGTGGAASFLEDMARAGVGEFVLIDPDTVSETNIATQQVYRRDLGRSKVICIAERIHDINPAARILPLAQSLDEIEDEEFTRLALHPAVDNASPPCVTLLCGFTDNFYAQARVNRLALHLGLPSLSAQVYREGRGAEIVFTYPSVTPACQRCILSSRYRAYLDEAFHNDVSSHGTPIFATSRLNALKGFVAMAIFHHGSGHLRWGSLLARIGARNLVQIRMDPDLSSTLGLRTFDRALTGGDAQRILFDEAIWLPQEPEGMQSNFPPCPDCGGSGDLRQAMGTFEDTRIMRPSAAKTLAAIA